MSTCVHAEICGRDALDGHDGACILHSKVENKDQVAFNDALQEHREARGLDFRHFVFPDGTDLSDVEVSDMNLGGADLSGVRLPEGQQEFPLLNQVTRATTYSRTILFTILLSCAYSWLTVITTTTAGLYSNGTTSQLPFVGTGMPIVGFYWSAPVGLLLLYIYFHLQLQRVWGKLASLPAIFPDGETLDRKADPWLFIGLARSHMPNLNADARLFSQLQTAMIVFIGWVLVPATIFLFTWKYIPRRDVQGTVFHVLLAISAVGAGWLFYRSARATLRGQDASARFHLLNLRLGTLAVAGAVLIGLCSWFAPEGVLRPYFPAPDLRGANLQSLDLTDASLRNANLVEANLAGANLQGLDLGTVELRRANLREANLRYANLRHARLTGADLRGANLGHAVLDSTILHYARLDSSSLIRTSLKDAFLVGAQMSHVKMYYTDADSSALVGADLSQSVVLKSSFEDAELRSTRWTNAAVSDSGFQKANLTAANFTGAFLDSDFPEATLKFAKLRDLQMEISATKAADIQFALGQADTARIDVNIPDSRVDGYALDQFFSIPSNNTEYMHKGFCKVEEEGLRGIEFGGKNLSRVSDSLRTNICEECPRKLGHLGTYPDPNDPRRCNPSQRPPNVESR